MLKPTDEGSVSCGLCPHACVLQPGQVGRCRVRIHRNGRIETISDRCVSSVALDPMEKKPLYHFYPGSSILSVGFFGCNLSCAYCQNWPLSQGDGRDLNLTSLAPKDLVARVVAAEDAGCVGVAYTYSEPTLWFEYVLTASQFVSEAGFQNVLVTNGYLANNPWKMMIRSMDAMNIDVKGFDPRFFAQTCGGDLSVVLRNVERALHADVHVEVTFLVIPGGTDDPQLFREFVDWLANLHPGVPLHLSRYFPHFRMGGTVTSDDTLHVLKEIAMQKLNNVYLGNVLSDRALTRCLQCGAVLVQRAGYRVTTSGLTNGGHCIQCGCLSDVIMPKR